MNESEQDNNGFLNFLFLLFCMSKKNFFLNTLNFTLEAIASAWLVVPADVLPAAVRAVSCAFMVHASDSPQRDA